MERKEKCFFLSTQRARIVELINSVEQWKLEKYTSKFLLSKSIEKKLKPVISSITTFYLSNLISMLLLNQSIDPDICEFSGLMFVCLFTSRSALWRFFLIHFILLHNELSIVVSSFIHRNRIYLLTYTGLHRLSSRSWSSMQAAMCRSGSRPLIPARLRPTSAQLLVSSSLEHRNYEKKQRKLVISCLMFYEATSFLRKSVQQ